MQCHDMFGCDRDSLHSFGSDRELFAGGQALERYTSYRKPVNDLFVGNHHHRTHLTNFIICSTLGL